MKNIQGLRKSYTKGELNENTLPENPFVLFSRWFDEMLKRGDTIFDKIKYYISSILLGDAVEVNAMCLTTAVDNIPRSRMVLMKGMYDDYIEFFTNYTSDKGKDLEKNPNVSVTFWWAPLQRQVTMMGVVEKLSDSRNDEYFSTRPRESKIGAWVSEYQSEIIKDRSVIESRQKLVDTMYSDTNDIPRPDYWGGYKIIPSRIEFWQGRVGRLHDRIIYIKNGNQWSFHRVSP